MKAIVQDAYGPVEVLKLREIERPVAGPGEVLVRVHAAGVNPADWHIMAGLPSLVRLAFGLRRPKNPVRGIDVAGVVDAVGAGVTAFSAGQRVFGVARGSFAEFAVAAQDKVALLPASLSFEQAASIPVAGCTALHAVRDAGRVSAGQRVMVIGAAGGIGTFAVQIAAALGARVTGVCSTSKLDLVRSLGAEHVIDYTVRDLEGESGFDVIIDTAGGRPLPALRRVLAARGRIVIVGAEGGGALFGALGRELTGVLTPLAKKRVVGLISSESGDDLRTLVGFVDAGTLVPVIEQSYPLAEAAAAISRITDGHARGKVVLTV